MAGQRGRKSAISVDMYVQSSPACLVAVQAGVKQNLLTFASAPMRESCRKSLPECDILACCGAFYNVEGNLNPGYLSTLHQKFAQNSPIKTRCNAEEDELDASKMAKKMQSVCSIPQFCSLDCLVPIRSIDEDTFDNCHNAEGNGGSLYSVSCGSTSNLMAKLTVQRPNSPQPAPKHVPKLMGMPIA
jgi:hypothetical protein